MNNTIAIHDNSGHMTDLTELRKNCISLAKIFNVPVIRLKRHSGTPEKNDTLGRITICVTDGDTYKK